MSAGSAGETGLSGRDVVFTLDRGYRKPLVRRCAVSLVFAAVFAFCASNGIAAVVTWVLAAVFGAAALLYATRYAWTGRFRTRLSAEGIEIRGYLNHFVPWADVAGLDTAGYNAPKRSLTPATPYLTPSGAVNTGYDTVRRGRRRAGRLSSTAGYRSRLATVRVTRTSGHSLLLRAPLVTAWQSDPKFDDKVRLIHQWWQAYGKATFGAAGPTSG
jgi:Bacterial PH domain